MSTDTVRFGFGSSQFDLGFSTPASEQKSLEQLRYPHGETEPISLNQSNPVWNRFWGDEKEKGMVIQFQLLPELEWSFSNRSELEPYLHSNNSEIVWSS